VVDIGSCFWIFKKKENPPEKRTMTIPINRIDMIPPILLVSSGTGHPSTDSWAASSSISDAEGTASLNLATSFFNKGVCSFKTG
jgi:hypothetical protein